MCLNRKFFNAIILMPLDCSLYMPFGQVSRKLCEYIYWWRCILYNNCTICIHPYLKMKIVLSYLRVRDSIECRIKFPCCIHLTLMSAPTKMWLYLHAEDYRQHHQWTRMLIRGKAVIWQVQYTGELPDLSTRFPNTTPARLFGLESDNLSHGSPSSSDET